MPLPFTYVADPGRLADEPDCFTARLPPVDGRKALFEALAAALRLPGYFGHNWDALEECLRDLSWIAERRVRLVHAAGPPPFFVYLEVLRAAQVFWRGQPAAGGHQLEVVFPSAARARVAELLGEATAD